MQPVHLFNLTVPAEVMDENRHANNVAYVQWMQEAATQHSAVCGGTRLTQSLGATWVIRTHRIEYLSPAFAGDAITVETWVANFRKVRSLRRYKFIRAADQTILAEAETDWVFVDAATGRPQAIPDEIRKVFGVPAGEAAEARE